MVDLYRTISYNSFLVNADVMKLVDLRSLEVRVERRAGSSPVIRTK